MNKNEIIGLDKDYIAQFYGRMNLAPVGGKNATVIDADGAEYIDFTSCGIGACLVCVCDMTNGKRARVCKDGPVFNAKDVIL